MVKELEVMVWPDKGLVAWQETVVILGMATTNFLSWRSWAGVGKV